MAVYVIKNKTYRRVVVDRDRPAASSPRERKRVPFGNLKLFSPTGTIAPKVSTGALCMTSTRFVVYALRLLSSWRGGAILAKNAGSDCAPSVSKTRAFSLRRFRRGALAPAYAE